MNINDIELSSNTVCRVDANIIIELIYNGPSSYYG